MSNQVCLLCLQVNHSAAKKSPTKIKIETLCNLLTLRRHNYEPTQYLPPEFEDDEICEFCDDCYPLISKMEEIRNQILLLEEEIVSKVGTIQATILLTSSSSHSLKNEEDRKIVQIRDMILRMTGGNEQHEENFITEEVHVKVEPETEVENDVDPLGDMDDCLNPSPQPIVDKIKAENSLDDDDEDPFYRTFSTSPPSPKTSRGRTSPTPTITAPPLRKRKRRDSPAARKTVQPKTVKLQSKKACQIKSSPAKSTQDWLKCPVCDKVFNCSSTRSRHIRFFHLPRDKKPSCVGCKLILSSDNSLLRHQKACKGIL
ncbi:uncharacterized protein LOC110861662 isoform X2 [Folsomia candida]|uniref:uncharacterized protein LOC110861662 isoform X2 n=1 Tax=Folsomia candida TaxID=158441 RepID=UPI000B900B93|nr:uncharacterized protein LOC110861662 isoform X2 [Folsomia candida]